jgi:hypothetical protein
LQLLSPQKAACTLALPFMPDIHDPFADILFIGWQVKKKRPRLPLLPPAIRSMQRHYILRRWGTRAAVAFLALAIGNAAYAAHSLAGTFLESRDAAVQNSTLEKKLERERSIAEPVTQPLGRLRQALERQRLFAAAVPSPWPVLLSLNATLGSEARLVKLDWRDDSGKFNDEVLLIDARLTDQVSLSDRQAIISRFQTLTETLSRTLPNYAVSIAHYPFPALPHEALSNSASNDIHAASLPTTEILIRRITP